MLNEYSTRATCTSGEMSNKLVLPIVRHLVEVDDLRNERDGELLPDQEPIARKIARDLYELVDNNKPNKLLFIHSSKKRASATALMTEECLLEIDPKIKIVHYVEPNIRDISHGRYRLPVEYEPGDFYRGFSLADKIFYNEVFENSPFTENLLYRYGDPLLQNDGTYTYPELDQYFISYGESFRDALVRIYSEVHKFTSDYWQRKDSFRPVMFSHGLPLEIYKDLAEVAYEVIKNSLKFRPGKLARVCYVAHRTRNSEEGSHGRVDLLPLDFINNPKFISILDLELEYLESL